MSHVHTKSLASRERVQPAVPLPAGPPATAAAPSGPLSSSVSRSGPPAKRGALIVVAGALAAVLWLGVLTQPEGQEIDEAARGRELANVSRILADDAARTLKRMNALAALAGERFRAEQPGVAAARPTERPGADRVIRELAVADRSGNVVWSTASARGVNVGETEYFAIHAARDTGEAFVSAPVTAGANGQALVKVTRRINRPDGSFGGIASAGADADHFSHLFRRIDLGSEGAIVLAGRNGVVRASHLAGGATWDSIAPLLAELEPGDGAARVARGPDGVRRLWGVRSIEGFPSLALVVGTGLDGPLAGAMSRPAQAVGGAAAGTAALVLLAAVLAWTFRERDEIRRALRTAERGLSQARSAVGALTWEWDHRARRLVGPRALFELLGEARGVAARDPERLLERVHPDDRGAVREALAAALRDGRNFDLELRWFGRSESVRRVRLAGRAARSPEDGLLRVDGLVVDLTDRAAASAQATEDSGKAVLLETVPVGVAVLADGRVARCNARFAELLGYRLEELIDKFPAHLREAQQRLFGAARIDGARVEGSTMLEGAAQVRRTDGTPVWLSARLGVAGSDTVWTLQDVTVLKRAAVRLAQLTHFDPLTGLPTVELLRDRLERAAALASRSGRLVACLRIDVDLAVAGAPCSGSARDETLPEIARRLRATLRTSDTLAHLGDGRFAAVLPDLNDATGAGHAVERVMRALALPIDLAGTEAQPIASAGIAMAPADGRDAVALVACSEAALERARSAGHGTFEYHDPALTRRALDAVRLAADLRSALQRGELQVRYQPVFALDSGRVVAVEAKLQWQRGSRLVAHAELAALFDGTGLGGPAAEWLIATACREIARWRPAGPAQPRLALSIPTQLLDRGDAAQIVARAAADSGLDPSRLELGVQERALANLTPGREEAIAALHALGAWLVVEDFGSQGCSPALVKRLGAAAVRLAGADVASATPDGEVVAGAVAALARKLRLAVVATSVDATEARALAERLGVDAVQGLAYAPPLPAEDLPALTDEPVAQLVLS